MFFLHLWGFLFTEAYAIFFYICGNTMLHQWFSLHVAGHFLHLSLIFTYVPNFFTYAGGFTFVGIFDGLIHAHGNMHKINTLKCHTQTQCGPYTFMLNEVGVKLPWGLPPCAHHLCLCKWVRTGLYLYSEDGGFWTVVL